MAVAGPRRWERGPGPHVHRSRREQRPHHPSDPSLAKDQQTFGDCRPERRPLTRRIGASSLQSAVLPLLQQLKHISLNQSQRLAYHSWYAHCTYTLLRRRYKRGTARAAATHSRRMIRYGRMLPAWHNGVNVMEWLIILLIIFFIQSNSKFLWNDYVWTGHK